MVSWFSNIFSIPRWISTVSTNPSIFPNWHTASRLGYCMWYQEMTKTEDTCFHNYEKEISSFFFLSATAMHSTTILLLPFTIVSKRSRLTIVKCFVYKIFNFSFSSLWSTCLDKGLKNFVFRFMAKNFARIKRKTSFVGRSVIKVFHTYLDILYRQFALNRQFCVKVIKLMLPHDKTIKPKWHFGVCREVSSISSPFSTSSKLWFIRNGLLKIPVGHLLSIKIMLLSISFSRSAISVITWNILFVNFIKYRVGWWGLLKYFFKDFSRKFYLCSFLYFHLKYKLYLVTNPGKL